MTKVIIAAGGKATRWGNYLGVPKHKIEIDGETISDRTIRLFKEHELDAILLTEGRSVFGDLDKIYSSYKYWNEEGRTIIVFGDVYFTEEAIQKIVDYPHTEFTVFGRIFESQLTGKGYGELFAVSFYENNINEIIRNIKRVRELYNRGCVRSANLWALYRSMQHFPDDLMDHHYCGDNFVNIDDWTEDFDYSFDFDRWLENYNKLSNGEIS